ncbi:MAG: carboxypeptidase-like regulatory domain-containing protein, partial [Acidobacteriota bacterium]
MSKPYPCWTQRFLMLLLAVGVPLLLMVPRYTAAQSLISGDIAGIVTDQSGAAIPGATVVVKNTGTGLTKTMKTGAAGDYHIGLLQPGPYTVTVSMSGFQAKRATTAVAVGQTATVNMSLGVAKGTQTVEVMGNTVPLLQPQNSDISTTISEKQVHNLPNPGGDITYYVNLTQGVVMNTQGGYGNSSAFGLPATSNNFTINGAEDNDPFLNLNNSG